MANEITVAASLSYVNTTVSIPLQQLSITAPAAFSITGTRYADGTFSVPTSAGGTAIPIGGLPTLGWAIIKNNDPTNYVDIMTAVSGTAFIRLQPGAAAVFTFTPAITAPAALAHTAPCIIQYLFLEI